MTSALCLVPHVMGIWRCCVCKCVYVSRHECLGVYLYVHKCMSEVLGASHPNAELTS